MNTIRISPVQPRPDVKYQSNVSGNAINARFSGKREVHFNNKLFIWTTAVDQTIEEMRQKDNYSNASLETNPNRLLLDVQGGKVRYTYEKSPNGNVITRKGAKSEHRIVTKPTPEGDSIPLQIETPTGCIKIENMPDGQYQELVETLSELETMLDILDEKLRKDPYPADAPFSPMTAFWNQMLTKPKQPPSSQLNLDEDGLPPFSQN